MLQRQQRAGLPLEPQHRLVLLLRRRELRVKQFLDRHGRLSGILQILGEVDATKGPGTKHMLNAVTPLEQRARRQWSSPPHGYAQSIETSLSCGRGACGG